MGKYIAFIVVAVGLRAQMLLPIIGNVVHSSGPVCCTVINGVSGLATSGTTASGGNTLNVAAHDQILFFLSMYGDCTTTATVNVGSNSSSTRLGACIQDQQTGTTSITMIQIADASANATASVSVVFSANPVYVRFSAVQFRGSANAAPDQTNNRDNSGASCNDCGVSNVTTTTAKTIVLAGVSLNGSGPSGGVIGITPTSSGCFGSTGTVAANSSPDDFAISQYVVLSSTATNTCKFNFTVTGTPTALNNIQQLAVFH